MLVFLNVNLLKRIMRMNNNMIRLLMYYYYLWPLDMIDKNFKMNIRRSSWDSVLNHSELPTF